jgi:NTE family protein
MKFEATQARELAPLFLRRPTMNEKKIDGVFEGGGVKGIGLVGAIAETEARGSAGAIVAALVAAGYKAAELKEIMSSLDYKKFRDEGLLDHVPLIGHSLSLLFEKGIYEGKYFEGWISDLLREKKISTFGDLIIREYADDPQFRYRLQVVASDISNGKMLVLPGDIKNYGFNPDDLGVARAVRMSMSIPFFFEPVALQDARGNSSYIVDGGLLSNFPLEVLDEVENNDPAWPTIGYKLVDPNAGQPHDIHSPFSLLAALFSTMMEAHDARYIEAKNFARTIPIKTGSIKTTDFDIKPDEVEWLYNSGMEAAKTFFDGWDFEGYKKQYLQVELPGRRERTRTRKVEVVGGL